MPQIFGTITVSRRHLDGHRGHEVFAGVARGDRRLDRNRVPAKHGRPARHRRLRQEHARRHDGHGPPEHSHHLRLRRHHHARALRGRDLAIVCVFEAVGEFTAGKLDEASCSRSSARPARARARAAACTPPTPCPPPSRRWACACPTRRRWRPRTRRRRESAAESARGAGRGDQASSRAAATSSRAGRSRTPSRWSWRWAARPTRCCTCWPSPTRRRCRWTLDDFERIRGTVPVLCDLKPSGRYVATDLHRAGGIPQVMKMLLVHGLLHGDCHHHHRPDARRGPARTSRTSLAPIRT